MSLADCPICWDLHCEHQCPPAFRSASPITKDLVVVGNDDWWGLYQDGKLIHEGHDSPNSALFREVVKAAGISLDIRHADYDWMCETGRLPEKLKDVKFGKSL